MTDKIFASYDFDSGTAAARPATPTVSDGRLYIYAATDTDVISVWDGAAWTVAGKLGQLPGTVTNDNAAAGRVGEYLTAEQSTSLSLTNFVEKDIVSMTLTPGDWDVWETIFFIADAGTIMGQTAAWTSLTSATLPSPLYMGGMNLLYGSPPYKAAFLLSRPASPVLVLPPTQQFTVVVAFCSRPQLPGPEE